jgi:hypothetical protein
MRTALLCLALVACGGEIDRSPQPPADAGVDQGDELAPPAGPCCTFNDGTGTVCCGTPGAVGFFYDSAGRAFGCTSAGEQCAPAYACAAIAPDGHSHLGHCE